MGTIKHSGCCEGAWNSQTQTGDLRAVAEIARQTSRSSVREGGGTTLESWETIIMDRTSVVNDNAAGEGKCKLGWHRALGLPQETC